MQKKTIPDAKKRSRWNVNFPMMCLMVALAAILGLWVARKDTGRNAPAALATTPPKLTDTSSTPQMTPQVEPAPSAPTPPSQQPVPPEEEENIFNWLTESETPALAAQTMLASWKKLSEAGKLAVAHHVVNLAADDSFEPVAALLLDEENGTEVKEVIFADVINRSDQVKWPLLLKVMEQDDNPLSAEARRVLSFVLGTDFKDDWSQWREHVESDLLKQPVAAAPPVGNPR